MVLHLNRYKVTDVTVRPKLIEFFVKVIEHRLGVNVFQFMIGPKKGIISTVLELL